MGTNQASCNNLPIQAKLRYVSGVFGEAVTNKDTYYLG
jgi:hypothetical protein